MLWKKRIDSGLIKESVDKNNDSIDMGQLFRAYMYVVCVQYKKYAIKYTHNADKKIIDKVNYANRFLTFFMRDLFDLSTTSER